MSVQTVNQRLDRRFVQVSNVTRRLPRFLSSKQRLRIDRPESIDDDLSTDGLDRVNDNGDRSFVELLK